MNFRIVLLGLGVVGISVASTVFTLHYYKPTIEEKTVSTTLEVPTGSAQPIPSVKSNLVGSAPVPPPPPETKKEVPPAPPSLDLSSLQTPPEFDAKYDSRKPLSLDEVKNKFLKKAPDCWEDFDSLCGKNRFLTENPLACLRSKKDQLSRACHSQVTALQESFHTACASDIERFCPQQKRFFPCLREKLPQLSDNCRKNIMDSSR